MKKSALRFLILTCLFKVAHCVWNKYVDTRMTWSKARDYCRNHHIDLSSISNQEENEKFCPLRKGRRRNAWIGLHKNKTDTWEWSDGTNASFFKWSAVQNKSEDNRCVVQNRKGWRKMNCEGRFHFYCSQNRVVLVKENKTWEEAMEHCRHEHTDLVSLPSESVLHQILETSGVDQTGPVWIGLHYLADKWLSVNGDKEWYQDSSGEEEMPQCPSWSQRCGALSWLSKRRLHWDCADKLYFVCY